MTIETQTARALAEQFGQDMQRQGWMMAAAESCTGGLLAGMITSVAGSSAWFERGYVTYCNDAKVADLGVSGETLGNFGAVSEAVALEMANGALLASPRSHVAVSVTGIAGPGGATPGKPVGMVCFGFAIRSGEGIAGRAATQIFAGDRGEVRMAAVEYALRGVLDLIGARSTGVRATV